MKLLDHGSLELVEKWGSDEAIIAAARMSTGGAFRGWGPFSKCKQCGDLFDAPERPCPGPNAGTHPFVDSGRSGHRFADVPGDEKLLGYLWRKKHAGPFEMCGMTFEVQAPICVFRQWHRHRVPFGYSEASGRYGPVPAVDYLPTAERCLMADEENIQAGPVKGAAGLDRFTAEQWMADLQWLQDQAEKVYQSGLTQGVPKELARLALTLGRYSRMRTTSNLRGWLAFCKLRSAPDAQHEIKVFADAIGSLIAEHYPRTWALFKPGA